MTLTHTRITALSLAVLAVLAIVGGAFAAGGAAAVPDARITLGTVDVAPGEPTVGERTAVNVTVTNSGGSAAAANVTEVRVRNADGDVLDSVSGVGALSAGDSLDATLWTSFDEPGEKRLTVQAVANQSTSGEFVTVSRDAVIEVRPTEVALDLRTRALDPEDLQTDDGNENPAGDLGIGGIQGIFGGGGGLDTGDGDQDGETPLATDSPVEVTVVNTGTTTADRVSLRAVGTAVDGAADGDDAERTVSVGPFVVEDVAPGEERRVIVDLGPLDRRSAVTVTAAFRADTDVRNDRGADRTAESTVTYPVRESTATVTDATVRESGDGTVVVDANLGNAGEGEMTGAVVSVGDAPGVEPTPTGSEYFVGSLGASDFVGFELETAVNASVAEEIPIRVTYTERGVRYTETLTVAAPESDDESEAGGTLGRIGVGGVGAAGAVASGLALVGLAGAVGVAVRTGRIGGPTGRRRDGSAP